MAFTKGSLILIDCTGRVKDTGEVFETTIEADAKKHGLYGQDARYAPKLVSIGDVAYPVLKGLGEELAKMAAGDKLTVEVPPAKGFGERDSGKVRMIPLRKLGEDAEKVSVGDTIEIDNKVGTIRFISSGRVQIDYNHKYAGKTIAYDVSVVQSLDSPKDKVGEIVKSRLAIDDTALSFQLEGDSVMVDVPADVRRAEGLQMTKHLIQLDIFKFVPDMKKVSFVETHVNKAATEPEPGAAAAPEPAPEPAGPSPAEKPAPQNPA